MGNRFGDNAPVAVIELIDGPGDLKNQMLFKALARQENKKAGSIASITELVRGSATTSSSASSMSVTGGSSLNSKTLSRHLPKVLTSNKWELADLEAKVRNLSINGSETSGKIFDATKA